MNPPQTKAELFEAMTAGRKEWEDVLAQVGEPYMRQPGVEGIWSVRDIVAHVCAYEQYMAAMLADMKQPQASETTMLDSYYQTNLTMYRAEHPELPEQLQELHGKQINEVFTAAYRYKRASEVLSLERAAYQKLCQWIEQYPDEELRQPYVTNGGSIIEVIAKQTYTHYNQHVKAIRAWLENRK